MMGNFEVTELLGNRNLALSGLNFMAATADQMIMVVLSQFIRQFVIH